MSFPPVRNAVDSREWFIDATPLGYALRILLNYRKKCDEEWITSGMTKEESLVFSKMNEDQQKRGEDLDRAISILLESGYEPNQSDLMGEDFEENCTQIISKGIKL